MQYSVKSQFNVFRLIIGPAQKKFSYAGHLEKEEKEVEKEKMKIVANGLVFFAQ